MTDLQRAKQILNDGGYTCVLVKQTDSFHSLERGVKPLVGLVQSGKSYKGYCAADKVVGKATAFLYTLLNVKAVHANVISQAALEVLKPSGIEVYFDTLTDHIINRKGDGICPFEQAVLFETDAQKAYIIILNNQGKSA